MTAFAAQVLRSIRAQGLLSPGARIALAASGGPDSTALLLVMLELARSLGISIDCIVHVNHQLRGAASDADASRVGELAARHGLECVVRQADVAAYAREHRCSVETAGHRLRHRVFAELRAERGLDAVATGHTLDDQAETVLLRLIRGAATRGLRGMSPRRSGLVRPLLGTTRAAVEAYLASRGVAACDDASNRDLTIPRNRIRHELLPWLIEHYSPRIRESLARTAAHLAADDDYFLARVEVLTAEFRAAGDAVTFRDDLLEGVPLPVRRRAVQSLLRRIGVAETARRVELLDAALATGRPGPVTIGAISVSNDQGRIEVRRVSGRNGLPPCGIEAGIGHTELLPGQDVEFGPWRVAASDAAGVQPSLTSDATTIDADQVMLPLRVRQRVPGDRLRPLGAPGRRKVQDILVDRKVPRASRDTTPIVVDAQGRIVWVAGHVVAHEMRVTATTTRMLLLTLRPAGGAV